MASKTVVLVHGGFVDGSGWQGVYDILRKDGYNVSIVQNPTLSLEGDVAATKRIIDAQGEPVILVGHSYGGGGVTRGGSDPQVGGPGFIPGLAPGEGGAGETPHPPPPPRPPLAPGFPPPGGLL